MLIFPIRFKRLSYVLRVERENRPSLWSREWLSIKTYTNKTYPITDGHLIYYFFISFHLKAKMIVKSIVINIGFFVGVCVCVCFCRHFQLKHKRRVMYPWEKRQISFISSIKIIMYHRKTCTTCSSLAFLLILSLSNAFHFIRMK